MKPYIARLSLFTLAVLIAVVGVGGLLVGPGCSKRGDAAKSNKVDCNKLCDKTFGACQYEVLLANGKTKKKKLDLLKKLGLLKKIQKKDHAKCLKRCQSKKGQFRDGKAVNVCLDIADCTKFATCITRYIK